MPEFVVVQTHIFADTFTVEAETEEAALFICHNSGPNDDRWNFDPTGNMVSEYVEEKK